MKKTRTVVPPHLKYSKEHSSWKMETRTEYATIQPYATVPAKLKYGQSLLARHTRWIALDPLQLIICNRPLEYFLDLNKAIRKVEELKRLEKIDEEADRQRTRKGAEQESFTRAPRISIPAEDFHSWNLFGERNESTRQQKASQRDSSKLGTSQGSLKRADRRNTISELEEVIEICQRRMHIMGFGERCLPVVEYAKALPNRIIDKQFVHNVLIFSSTEDFLDGTKELLDRLSYDGHIVSVSALLFAGSEEASLIYFTPRPPISSQEESWRDSLRSAILARESYHNIYPARSIQFCSSKSQFSGLVP
jgi:hypothetical protein